MKEMCCDERKKISGPLQFVKSAIVSGLSFGGFALVIWGNRLQFNGMIGFYLVLTAVNISRFLLPIFPGDILSGPNELISRDANSLIGLRQDRSNPLFVRGLLVKKGTGKEKKLSLFSEIKAYRFFQKVLIVEMIVVIERLCTYLYYEITTPLVVDVSSDQLIIFLIVASHIVAKVIMIYYGEILNRTRKKIFAPLCKKNIFWDFCQDVGSECIMLPYEKMYGYYILEWGERVFREAYDKFYTNWKAEMDSERENIEIEVREDRKKFHTQILLHAHFHELREEHIEMINSIFQKIIRRELRYRELPLVRPCLTCLIYVDVDSETFRKVVCRELRQQKEMICLYAGVVHEKRKAYISGQKGEYGQEEYQQMKEVVLKIFQKQELYEPW